MTSVNYVNRWHLPSQELSFRDYVFNRPYGSGRGHRDSWTFIIQARGDPDFPDVRSWRELHGYLLAARAPAEMVKAARTVWNSFSCQRDRRRRSGA
jgi:hypothetical protein